MIGRASINFEVMVRAENNPAKNIFLVYIKYNEDTKKSKAIESNNPSLANIIVELENPIKINGKVEFPSNFLISLCTINIENRTDKDAIILTRMMPPVL